MSNPRLQLFRSCLVAGILGLALLAAACQPTASAPTASIINPSGNSVTTTLTTLQSSVGSSNSNLPGQQSLQQPGQQPQPTQPPTATPVQTLALDFNNSLEVNAAKGAVQVSFTLETAQFINIIARSVDGVTNPRIILFSASERLMAFSDDFIAARDDLNDVDAMIDDVFLIPGSYSVRVEGLGGDGRVNLSTEPAQGGVLGTGQMTTLTREIGAGQSYVLPLTLSQNELVSIMAISSSATLDPRLRLRNPAGELIARNDDSDSFDPILDVTDSKIEYLVVPATDTYELEVRGFSKTDAGVFTLVIFRYGTLEPVAEPQQVLTGIIRQRQRLSFPLELAAGEVISVTARAARSQIDPLAALLDPDKIIVVSNDDHNTQATDVTQFDARFTGYVTQTSGTYTLDLESVSGRGAYEVVIRRAGKVNPDQVGAPIDPDAGGIVTPAPSPEATAEVTPGS